MVGGTVTFVDEMLIQALDFDHLKWVKKEKEGGGGGSSVCVSGGKGNEDVPATTARCRYSLKERA